MPIPPMPNECHPALTHIKDPIQNWLDNNNDLHLVIVKPLKRKHSMEPTLSLEEIDIQKEILPRLRIYAPAVTTTQGRYYWEWCAVKDKWGRCIAGNQVLKRVPEAEMAPRMDFPYKVDPHSGLV